MKTWVVVLIIGFGILIAGAMIPVNSTFGFGGMYVMGLGIALIIGAIIAAARRLMNRMVND